MTHDEFIRQNPIICTTYGIMGYNTYDAMVMQGEFLSTRTFIFDSLDNLEAEFIKLRYGVGTKQPAKLNDIAESLNLNLSKVKQLDLKVLRKLRHPYRIRLLKEYTDETIDRSLIDLFNKPKSL